MNRLLMITIQLIIILLASCGTPSNVPDAEAGETPQSTSTTTQTTDTTPFEIELNGVSTKFYPDKDRPKTVFWYKPSALWIARQKEGVHSRLGFSIEVIHQDEPVNVNMVISPRYPPDYEDKLRKAICEMRKEPVNPFEPSKSYELIEFRLMSYENPRITFDELFRSGKIMGEQRLKSYLKNLHKPFPLTLQLNYTDATILLESLTQQRTKRVARLEHGNNEAIPIYIDLEFSPLDMPVEHRVERIDGEYIMTISNPTEHEIMINHIKYEVKNKFPNIKTVMRSIPASKKDKKVNEIKITLDEKPYIVQDIDFTPKYDYADAIKQYWKNKSPKTVTEVTIEINAEKNATQKHLLNQFDALFLEINLIDKNGRNNRKEIRIGGNEQAKSEIIKSFGKANSIKYRLVGKQKNNSTPFVSQWKEYPQHQIGEKILIDFRYDIGNLISLETGSTENMASVDDVMVVSDDLNSSSVTLVPGQLAIVKTNDGTPKYQVTQAGNGTEGYMELFCPIYPATIRTIKNRWSVESHQIAKLKRAILTIDINGYKPVDNKEIEIDPQSHLRCYFNIDATKMEHVVETIESYSDRVTVSAKLYWVSGGKEFITNNISYPLQNKK